MEMMSELKTDREGHNKLYKDRDSSLITCPSKEAYVKQFKLTGLSPYWKGGGTKGYVRGLAVEKFLRAVKDRNLSNSEVRVLDAGCGQGELSVYLAALGFQVVGVDISKEACMSASRLAKKMGVSRNCQFKAESLEEISLADDSVDYVLGMAALHHFIKYEGVAQELNRVLKETGEMFFADSFGENRAYHIFHNKEQMHRLGDVILTRELIKIFFAGSDVTLTPTDWFVMLDKLFLKILPRSASPVVRLPSCLWWYLDRLVPINGVTLYLSGAVMTHVKTNRTK